MLSRFRIDLLEIVITNGLQLCLIPIPRRHIQCFLNLARQASLLHLFQVQLPDVLRSELLRRQRGNRHNPGRVPMHRPAELGKGPAIKLCTGIQAHRSRRNFEPDPLTGGRQLAHFQIRCVVSTSAMSLICTPIRTVLP